MIAQCLSAAQHTVPADFTVHSMHCYFVLAGNAEIPIIYHVERVRDGRSFATRTVQARQRAKAIFTVTLSFQQDVPEGHKTVEHSTAMPEVEGPDEQAPNRSSGPFESRYSPSVGTDPEQPSLKRTRMWLRAKGPISAQGGHEAHLSALAYMSDSFFIGTVARAHKLWRDFPKESTSDAAKDDEKSARQGADDGQARDLVKRIKAMNGGQLENVERRPEIGMMVSLDHTIYFHQPRDFRADDWLLSEMETPWAGDNRGLVCQRIWTKEGLLIATCYQEVSLSKVSHTGMRRKLMWFLGSRKAKAGRPCQ